MDDAAERQLAADLCAKSGQIGAYRTAAFTIRGMLERFGVPTPEQWKIVAEGFEQKADELDKEVLAHVPAHE